MTNAVYPKAKQLALGAGMNLTTATVKALLIDTALYTYSAAHQFLSDVPAGARVGVAATLTSKTITDGAFTAGAINVSGLSGAPSVEAVIIYVDTGLEASSYLVAYLDQASSGLPTTPGAPSIAVSWASPIFTL